MRCGCISERFSPNWLYWILKVVYMSVTASKLVMATVPNRQISIKKPKMLLEA